MIRPARTARGERPGGRRLGIGGEGPLGAVGLLERWEEFAVPRRPNMNIISCLQYKEIQNLESIATVGRQATLYVIKRFFSK